MKEISNNKYVCSFPSQTFQFKLTRAPCWQATLSPLFICVSSSAYQPFMQRYSHQPYEENKLYTTKTMGTKPLSKNCKLKLPPRVTGLST